MATRTAPRRGEAQTATAPALRLVDDASPRHRALTRAATVLATFLAGAGLFGVVGLHVLLTQGQAELDQLHARADAEAARNGQLTVDVALLEAPTRIVDVARGELGMVPLAAVVYLPDTDPASPLPAVPAAPLPSPPASGAPAAATATNASGTATSATATSAAKTASSTTPTTTAAKTLAAGRP